MVACIIRVANFTFRIFPTYNRLPVEESAGPTYYDYYGGHNSNACSGGNCPTVLTPGRVSDAQTFDGSNTGIDVPTIPGISTFDWGKDDSFSIEFWMKADPGACTGPKNEVIIGRDDTSNPNSDLHWWVGCDEPDGEARFRLEDIDNTTGDVQGEPPVNDGKWHHIVAIRDGDNKFNRLYVDNTEVASTTKIYSAGFDSTAVALNIGYLDRTSGFHFDGVIDEVAIYNDVLGADTIASHYIRRTRRCRA